MTNRPAVSLGFRPFLWLTVLVALSASSAFGAGLWSEAVLVGEDDDYNCEAPGVAVAADGTVLIVWSATDPEELDSEILYVSVSDTGQSQQMLVHEPNTGMDRIAFLSTGPAGVPWLVWERYGDGYEQVVSHWDGTSWAVPETVFSQGGRYDWYSIHAAGSGNVWVARDSRSEAGDRDVVVRNSNGGEWGAVEQMGIPGEDDEDPIVVVDADGRVVVAWLTHYWDSRPNRIHAVVGGVGGWSAPAVVDSSRGNIGMCDADLLPDGRPIVTWVGNGYTTASDIKYSVLEGETWSPADLVNEPDVEGVDTDLRARISRASSGELWAVWNASVVGANVRAIKAAKWLHDGWTREELVSAPDTAHLSIEGQTNVAVGEDGTVWAVWQRKQLSFPWDTDVYGAVRHVPDPEGIWALSAHTLYDTAVVSWRVSGVWKDGGFHVWRLTTTSLPEWNGPYEVPPGAVRLTDSPVSGCSSCAFTDITVEPENTYLYWIQGERGTPTLGPAALSVLSSGALAEGIIGVRPNPTSAGASFDIAWSRSGQAELAIFTIGGRLVRQWPIARGVGARRAQQIIYWDGTDSSGRRLPSGIYFAALVEEGRSLSGSVRTIVILR